MIRIPKSREKGVGAVALLEEAVALLRSAPLEIIARYYLGTLPFMLGLLWFWSDMSRSADAHLRLSGSALALALLFIWMKVWQAGFAGCLLARLGGGEPTRSVATTVLVQGGLQPWGFILLPLAALVTLPFGWCYAFFQNLTVLGGADWRSALRTARRQALLWPGQNHLLLVLLSLIFLVLFANLAVSAYVIPRLLKTLFGIESIFTRSNTMLLNSTFWAAVAVVTHLCFDPLVKACYVLRCHYGASLASGADLRAQLQTLGNQTQMIALGVILSGLLGCMAQPAIAGDAPAVSDRQRVEQLDRAIEQVINEPRFAWRLPREGGHLEKQELPGFLRATVDWIHDAALKVGRWIRDFFSWLDKKIPKPRFSGGSPGWGGGFAEYALLLLYTLLALLLAAGAVFAWRRLRRNPSREEEIPTHPAPARPDLNDESLMATELDEERWAALARELLAKGELRLGLRALYLGSLAALAEARLLAIARFKTNRDYERELLRFSHALPGLSDAFSLNLRIFEAAWYGMHVPDQETVQRYIDNCRRISANARTQ